MAETGEKVQTSDEDAKWSQDCHVDVSLVRKTYYALISDFKSVKSPNAIPASQIKVVNYPDPATSLTGSLQASFPDTSVKPQIIFHNNKKLLHPDSHTDEGRPSILSPNHHVIQAVIYDVQYKVASTTSVCESNETEHPRTELDSHANMVVPGMNAFIFESTGRTCSVNTFSSELRITDNVPIADVLIAYDFQCSHQMYILIICYALYIPSM